MDVLEVATMLTAGFGEPMTFSLRASRLVRGRLGQYDVVHDNQSLATECSGRPGSACRW